MSDQATNVPDLAGLIEGADEETWQRIRQALQVKTRKQAAQAAMADPKVAQIVIGLISGNQGETLPTPSVLTDGPSSPDFASQMYKGKAGKVRI